MELSGYVNSDFDQSNYVSIYNLNIKDKNQNSIFYYHKKKKHMWPDLGKRYTNGYPLNG